NTNDGGDGAVSPSGKTVRQRQRGAPTPVSPVTAAVPGGRRNADEDRRRSFGNRNNTSSSRGDDGRGAAGAPSGLAFEGRRAVGGRARGGGVLEAPGAEGDQVARLARWLRLLEAWAFPSVVLAFLVRQAVVASSREFWVAKAVEAWVSHERVAFFDSAERALLLGFPHGFEAGVFAAAVAAAARVRVLAGKRSPPSQSPGLAVGPLLTCLEAFGGNVLACFLLGTRNMVLTEEVVWPAAVAAWVLVGGRLWVSTTRSAFALRDFLSLPMVHHLLVFLSEAFRASLVCRAVDTAR
ncbi:unnamed protein product, partial [Pylaiella littoralis]